MKRIRFLLIAGMCLLLSSCGNSEELSGSTSEKLPISTSSTSEKLSISTSSTSEKLSISTPEKVYVTYYTGTEPDISYWELSQDEINDWVVWINNLTASPINLEESKILIDHVFRDGSHSGYSFDVGSADYLERIEYIDISLEHVYLRMNNDWYCIENPTEPFNKY